MTPSGLREGEQTLNGRNLLVVVIAASIITSIGLGVRATFGLFLDPVIDELGTGRGMFSLAIAIQNIVWGLSQPFFGAIADRFGRLGCSPSVRSATQVHCC